MGGVAVFGATGGVGRHAVLQLLGAGQEVIAVVRDPSTGTPLANAGARVVTHDLQHDDPRRMVRHLNRADSVPCAAGVHHGAPLDQLEAFAVHVISPSSVRASAATLAKDSVSPSR